MFPKETYNLIDPTDRSHPICCSRTPYRWCVIYIVSFAEYCLFYRACLQKRPICTISPNLWAWLYHQLSVHDFQIVGLFSQTTSQIVGLFCKRALSVCDCHQTSVHDFMFRITSFRIGVHQKIWLNTLPNSAASLQTSKSKQHKKMSVHDFMFRITRFCISVVLFGDNCVLAVQGRAGCLLAIQGFWFNLNLYHGIWVSRFGGFRGCSIFSGNCHITSCFVSLDFWNYTFLYWCSFGEWNLFAGAAYVCVGGREEYIKKITNRCCFFCWWKGRMHRTNHEQIFYFIFVGGREEYIQQITKRYCICLWVEGKVTSNKSRTDILFVCWRKGRTHQMVMFSQSERCINN